ncbi:MAG TPA: serine hydrolase domain-containing protein [Candidatus Eisenbacteria bacterium]|nr:serine hydrolase domain-containing protein [Candidatus Eisenbacteria bacterium]
MNSPRVLTAFVEGGKAGDHHRLAPPVPWWSLTKTALAAGALVLVAQGRLALDAYLRPRPYTLRQLLQHTAGVPSYGDLVEYHQAVERGEEPWSREDLLRRVGADRLLFSPGHGWAYSNVGYLHVRGLVEEVTGEELGAALRRLVFEPLGVPDVKIARERSDLDGTAWGNAVGYHPGWVYHGLAVGTPAEAALFLHRLMIGRLVPGELLATMCAPYTLGGPVEGRPWRTAGYGLGLMVDVASPRGRCLGHTGQGPGSVAAAYHFPDLDPPRTTAAFAPVEDQAVVERAVLAL